MGQNHDEWYFLTRSVVNTGWWVIDIHGCYSLLKIAFAAVNACKNNRRISRHDASISCSCDVTDQLWRRHNAKVEKTLLWRQWRNERSTIVFSEAVCSGHTIACKKEDNTFVTVNNDILVTREVICQWFSFVISSLVKIIAKSTHSWPKNRYSR